MRDLDANIRGAVEYEQDVSLRDALDAVLDLHADIEDGYGIRCAHCGPREIWPCPTRRVIGERLGVGVQVEHGRP